METTGIAPGIRGSLRVGGALFLSLVFVFSSSELMGHEAITSAPVSAEFIFRAESSSEPAPVVQRRRRRRRLGQRNPTPPRIREIQAALIEVDYLKGEPNGVWDEATAGAMGNFQKDNGFRVTGKPDALSLVKLGLGSETAGVGAPRKTTGQDSSDTPADEERSSGTTSTKN